MHDMWIVVDKDLELSTQVKGTILLYLDDYHINIADEVTTAKESQLVSYVDVVVI